MVDIFSYKPGPGAIPTPPRDPNARSKFEQYKKSLGEEQKEDRAQYLTQQLQTLGFSSEEIEKSLSRGGYPYKKEEGEKAKAPTGFKAPEPYISPLSRGPLPSAQDVSEYAKAYQKELYGTIPSVQPEIDKEASQQRIVDYLEKNKPEEQYGKSVSAASSDYLKSLKESQNILEPAAKQLSESYKEVVGEEGKPGLLEQLQNKYPHLTREEVEKEYGFGRKLLVSILGGIGGNPQIANQAITQKLADNQRDYESELDRMLALPKVSLQRFEAETARHSQKTDFLVRTMNALEEKAKADLVVAESPLKIEAQKQVLADIQKNKAVALAEQQTLKLKTNAAIANAMMQVQNNPLAIRLPFSDPTTGRAEFIVANGQDSLKQLNAELPTWDVLLQPNGPVDALKQSIRKEELQPGQKQLSSKEKKHLFERIKELNPQEKSFSNQAKRTPAKEYTDHDMMLYIQDMQKYFSTWLLIHGHRPTIDTRALGVPQSETQPVKGE